MQLNIRSLATDEDVDAEVGFRLDIGLQVRHFEVVIHPVDYEVGEWVFSVAVKQLAEQFETLLAEIVAEEFVGQQGLVLNKRLSQQSETQVIDSVVSHV